MSPQTVTRPRSTARLRRVTARPVLTALGTPVLAALGVLVLAGCGAGQTGTIGNQVAAVNGGTGDLGEVSVREVQVEFPPGEETFWSAGDDAPLLFLATTTATTADELVSITSPAATEVTVEGDTTLSGSTVLRSEPTEEGEDGGTPPAEVEPAVGQLRVELVELTQDVRPGLTIPVTFTFEQAGEITVQVPVAYPTGERAEEPAVEESGEPESE